MSEELVLDIVIDSSKSDGSIASMKKEVRELQGLLTQLDPGSEEFAKAAKRAAELKDNIDDTNEALQSMKGAGSLEGVNTSLGRMGERIKNLDFDGLSKDIGLMGNSISNIKLGDFTKGIQSMGAALGKLGAAIITNPVFLLAATIAAVTAATIIFYNSIDTAADKQETYNELLNESKTAISENLSTLQVFTKNLKDSYGNQDEFNKAVKDWNENIAGKYTDQLLTTTSSLNDIALAAENARQNIIKMGIAQAAQAKVKEIFENNFDALLKYQEVMGQAATLEQKRSKLQEELNKKMKENPMFAQTQEFRDLATQIKSLEDRITSLNQTGQIQNTGYISPLIKQGKDAQDEINFLLDLVDKYSVTINKNTENIDKNTNSKKDNNNETKRQIEHINKLIPIYDKLDEKIKEIEERKIPSLIDPAILSIEYTQDILAFEESNKQKLEILKYYNEQGLINNKDYKNATFQIYTEDLENYRAVNNTMSNISSSFFEFLGNLSEENQKKQKKIAKTAFGINKATSAVETGINTAQAIMKIAATTPPPFSIPLQILTGIQGAAQIAAILSKKFPENGETGGASSTNVSTPSSSIASPSITNLYTAGGGTPTTFQSLSANNQGMNRVYVLAQDISDVQQNISKVNVMSTF